VKVQKVTGDNIEILLVWMRRTLKTSQNLAESNKRKEKEYLFEERWFWNFICGCYRRLL